MKKKLLLFLLITITHIAKAQDCGLAMLKTGNEWEMESFDAKDKLTSKTKYKVLEVKNTNGYMEAKLNCVITNDKGNELQTVDCILRCKNGVVEWDMSQYVNKELLKAYEGMDIQAETKFLEYPNSFAEGQELKEGRYEMKISSNGTAVGVVTCDIAKRKVIAIENLETKAGNFKAAKIAQSSLITIAVMGFPIKTEYSSEEWIYEGMVVKSIVYNKSGKKLSSTLLSYKNF